MAQDIKPVAVVRTVQALRERVHGWRDAGFTVGLVPTMGALHDGHLSLVDRIRHDAGRVVVSIFVNPKQFGPSEDFQQYPRDEAADLERLAAAGVDLVFAPALAEVYPPGFGTRVIVTGVTRDMEGAHRPDFFEGVATVVTKLLTQCQPDVAIFGEKDYQQLVTIRRLVRDLDLPVRILAGPLIREPDGLAAASRNAYLDTDQRRTAGQLNVVLAHMVARAEAGEPLADLERTGRQRLIDAGFDSVDYLTFRDGETLAPIDRLDRPARLLVVARLGGVRLLDNMAVAPGLSPGRPSTSSGRTLS